MKRLLDILWWAVTAFIAYVVLAPVILCVALLALLTPGVIDWSGKGRVAPADPMVIGYRGDPQAAFGWTFETVRYPTELGEAEAWLVPASAPSDLWAIWVHGIGGTRENGYRMVQPLHDAGMPVLMITYRNDDGAPRSTDAMYSFGLTEWRDLEAAVGFAIGKGAKHVVIAAESMGGAITGEYLRRGSGTERVVGLALDAPALDFNEVIAAGGKRYHVPLANFVAAAGLELLSMIRVDLRKAVSYHDIWSFNGPIFLAHGERDPLVPFITSERLAEVRRRDITFWRTNADRHPMSFEEDRAGYVSALRRWIDLVRASPET